MTRENILIKVNNLTKKFGRFTAVDNLSFEVEKGEIFGFLGANGAGKTTVIKILCGILSPSSGDVSVDGFDVYSQTEKIKKNIGYMSQNFSLYEDLSVYENFRFFGGIYGLPRKEIKKRTDYFLKTLGLQDKKDSVISSLPLGWKQKIAFSVAQIHNPKIIFLDEPTSGVDPVTRRQFWDMIYKTAHSGITVFVTTHYMDEAEYCDRISIMDAGKIKAIDTPENLKKLYKENSIEKIFIKLIR
ncbi:MAG: ABC transporter ATP-binding protein [Bacteroidales bacterium]|nr:ABC transporter ATP-binding protein [Bacteroidales bacterium]